MKPVPTRHDPPDADLLRAAQGGDCAALERLAGRWWPDVRRWCLLELGDVALAEDASQEVLVRLVRFVGRCDPERPFGPWLRGITRNCCRDAGADRRRRREVEAVERAVEPRPDRALDLERTARRALAAFASLTPRQREVLDLCDRQGIPARDVAERLGIAPTTARVLLHQARRALRERVLADPEILALLREP